MSFISSIWFSIKQAVIPGFIAGAIVAVFEALIVSIFHGFLWEVRILYFYPVWGMAISSFFALTVLILTGFSNRIKRIRHLDVILFCAAVVFLTLPLAAQLLPVKYLGFQPQTFGIVFTVAILTPCFFGIAMLLRFLLSKISAMIKLKWQAGGALLAILLLIIIRISFAIGSAPPELTYGVEYEGNIKAAPESPNIILLVIDTLRKDHLSAYGCDINTPNIQSIAEDGILFDNAFVNCSWTKPTMASMFTSLYPLQHNVLTIGDVINPDLVLLAEALRRAGYYTVGFQNNPHISPDNNFHLGFNNYYSRRPLPMWDPDAPGFQLSRHHKGYIRMLLAKLNIRQLPGVTIGHYLNAEIVTRKGVETLKANPPEPFFLYLHYMDPHEPYFEHPFTGKHLRPPMVVKDQGEPSQQLINDYFKFYGDEVEYLDKSAGYLFDYLRQNNLYDNSLILIVSDHGEEFYEHENWGHGNTVYNELIHAVFIMKLPDSKMAGTVDTTLTQSIDIPPTLVNIANGVIPDNWCGRDLLNDKPEVDYIISIAGYGNGKAFCNSEEKLYIKFAKEEGTIESAMYFDLKADPEELNNLADKAGFKERVNELSDSLYAVEAELSTGAVTAGKTELDEATKEQLKALGYLQ